MLYNVMMGRDEVLKLIDKLRGRLNSEMDISCMNSTPICVECALSEIKNYVRGEDNDLGKTERQKSMTHSFNALYGITCLDCLKNRTECECPNELRCRICGGLPGKCHESCETGL